MRVSCTSVDDFLANLEIEGKAHVYREVVHVNICSRPLDGNKRDSAKFEVILQASAVIDTEDGGQFLLEVGENMGIDYNDASQEFAGSEAAGEANKRIYEVCNNLGLMVRPGIISF